MGSTTPCRTPFIGCKTSETRRFSIRQQWRESGESLPCSLANADILPFDYETYATDLMTPLKLLQNSGSKNKIAEEVGALDRLLTKWQQVAGSLNREISGYLAAGDLSRGYGDKSAAVSVGAELDN